MIEDDLENEEDLINEDNLKNKVNHKNWNSLKNEEDLKTEDDIKNKNDLKNEDYLKKKICPPPLKRILPEIFMTSHLDSFGTTDIKPEMLSGVQTGNGTAHDRYNIHGIAHARTSRKYNIFLQRRLVQKFTYIMELGQVTCTLTKHTRRWTYSALRHFYGV